MGVSSDQVAAYRRDGYVSGIRVVDEGEAAACRADFDALAEREGREASQIGLLDRHYTEEFIWRLVLAHVSCRRRLVPEGRVV